MKIGIIGLGNMGKAFAKCFIKAGHDVIVATPHPEKERELKDFLTIYKENKRVAEEAEILFIAVKPHQLEEVLSDIGPSLANHLIVSMAVGRKINWIKDKIGDLGIIRILPNTPVAIGKGVTAYTYSKEVVEPQILKFKELMRFTGDIIEVEEEQFDVFSAIAGSLPAFLAMVIEGASDGAVHEGMKRKDSYQIIANTMIGTCELMLQEKLHPGQLKDQVTSPGGSTIEGVRILEGGSVRHSFMEAIEKTVNKNKNMG